MDFIKQWALALCMACVAAGILQHFAVKTERFSVIKLVLTLYILVTAFTPLQALRYPETRYLPDLPASAPVEAGVDTDALVLARAEQSLAGTLREACAAANAPLSEIRVALANTEAGVAVREVGFTPQDVSQSEAAQNAIRTVVGTQVAITQNMAA